MKLLVIGVNHKTAPIALREQLAFADDELPVAFEQLNRCTEGSVILSTCNRTEIYLLAPDPNQSINTPNTISNNTIAKNSQDTVNYQQQSLLQINHTITQVKQWLADYKSLSLVALEPYLYVHYNQQALNHWIRVASGLDSMILGEPQILGQLKKSINQALDYGSMSSKFNWIVDQILTSAKQVRHDTKVGSQAVTLGFATAKLATQIFDNLSRCHLLVVASGEMNRLVANHIAGQGIGAITICNRNQQRATALAEELQQINPKCHIEARPLAELEACLAKADIVSSCSGSMQPLITFNMCKTLVKRRRYRSMLMVDLAVPRDIENKVNELDEIYLYSIDDLQHVIAGNLEQRKQAAVDAELLVSQLVVEIEQNFQARQVGGDINQYRQMAYQQADRLLAESLHRLKLGHDPAELILKDFSRRLTQTLTHAPSKLMRTVASEGDNDTLELVIASLANAYRRRPHSEINSKPKKSKK